MTDDSSRDDSVTSDLGGLAGEASSETEYGIAAVEAALDTPFHGCTVEAASSLASAFRARGFNVAAAPAKPVGDSSANLLTTEFRPDEDFIIAGANTGAVREVICEVLPEAKLRMVTPASLPDAATLAEPPAVFIAPWDRGLAVRVCAVSCHDQTIAL